ncbi:cell division transport system permease protein [Martelella mangrovi]|uniref:Cell division transport system permease protein n=2 Tax=Martelella mangrovi TaxID=1397477 RepID=A0ABV2IEW3_9HYPH
MTRPPRSIRDPRLEEERLQRQREEERRRAEARAREERLLEARILEERRREEIRVHETEAARKRQMQQEAAARQKEQEQQRATEAKAAREKAEAERVERQARMQRPPTPPTPPADGRPPLPRAEARKTPLDDKPAPTQRTPQARPATAKAGDAVSAARRNIKKPLIAGSGSRKPTPIVPPSNVQSRALMAVIAIMAFLACLTLGGVSMVRATAASWQGGISREVTIQIKPAEGRDMNQALLNARDVALQFVGTIDGQVVDEAATERLLEPWLGTGLDFDELPVPRLVIVTIDENNPPDFAAMADALQSVVPGAYLDDHRAWVDRLSAMADATTTIGASVMALVFSAMVLTVVFATRGALSGSRDIVEVLHFVGAEGSFVARQFQNHFLNVALKGAFLGGALACLFFVIARFWQGRFLATPGADQATALFGSISIGWGAYAGILLTIVIIAALTTLTARLTVIRTIREIDHIRSDPERTDSL